MSNASRARMLARVVAWLLEERRERTGEPDVKIPLADLDKLQSSMGMTVEDGQLLLALGDKER